MVTSKSELKTPRVAVVDYMDEYRPYSVLQSMIDKAGDVLQIEGCKTPEEVVDRVGRAWVLVVHSFNMDRQLIASLPECQLIIKYGVGYDNIDVAAATDCGVIVCNTPLFCTDEVADHTLMLLLAAVRRMLPLVASARAGRWGRDETDALIDRRTMHRLRGHTLGLVGFGRIAQAVAERARGFGLQVMAYDPYVDNRLATQQCVTPTSLDELLTQSDYVSIHVPLTTETRMLINAEKLALMKPTALLLNLGRGTVVDEAALIEALERRQLAGAALDVLAQEPPDTANPLLHMENVIVIPHYGSASTEALFEQEIEIGQSATALLRGQWPPYAVNRHVIPKKSLQEVERHDA